MPEDYFKSIKDYTNLQQVYSNYSTYFRNVNDDKNTIAYLDKLRSVESKLNDSLQRKSIIFYQTKFETQQKENKILLLSKADSIKNLKITNQQLAISKNLFELTRQKLALSGAQLQMAEDSLQLETQNKTILQTQLEASKKQAKINSLSKEALQQKVILQEKQLAINQKNTTIGIIIFIAFATFLIGYGLFRRKQMEQKALLVAEQIKQRELLTQAIIEAEEAERKRIASDLHDGVGQLFSAVKMNLGGLLNRVELKKEEDQFLAEKTMALVDESCKEVRVISHKMMPNFLLKSGIASDIKSFIEKIDENTLKISFESYGFKEQLEFNEEIILYRVIQELINNVIKHAKANELEIVLHKTNQNIVVKIIDNGIGFDYEKAINKGGLGLKNILVRMEYLKGKVNFTPNTPSGTRVEIDIPIG
jgi:signal transduction histidine kinase